MEDFKNQTEAIELDMAEFLLQVNIHPDYILGDFDSIDREVLDYYEHRPKFREARNRKKTPQIPESAWSLP